MPIKLATPDDVDQLTDLLNKGYRGDASRKGWTYEADLIAGDNRTDAETILNIMRRPDAVFFKYTNDDGQLVGCVNLQKQDQGLHLGMLCVEPELQASGIGKQLLAAAEEYAVQNGIPVIVMNVISLRKELIDWYERHGYIRTGKTKPFIFEDDRFGVATQPLEFLILEKQLAI